MIGAIDTISEKIDMRKTIALFVVILFLTLSGTVYYNLSQGDSPPLDVSVSSSEDKINTSKNSTFQLNGTVECQVDNCGNVGVYPDLKSSKKDKQISVAIFGDLQTSNPEFLPSYSKTVRSSSNGFPETDFAVSVGDVVGDSEGNYPTESAVSNSTNQIYNYQTTPFFQVIGNHDMSDWKNRPNRPWLGEEALEDESGMSANTYGFEYNNALFIVLGDEGGEARLKKQQLGWIDSMVDRHPEKPTFVFMHPEPTEHNSCGTQNRDYMHHLNEREDYPWYSEEFISRDNIKMVVHGHCEALPDNSFKGYYDVIDDTVTVGVPSFRRLFGQTEDNGYLEITESEIKMKIWDEKSKSFVNTRTHSSNLSLNNKGFGGYYLPHFFQDGEEWKFNNRIAGKDAEVKLIGTNYTGKGYNNHFNKFASGGCNIGYPGYQGSAEDSSESGTVIFNGSSELRHIDSDEGCGNDGPHHVMPKAVPGEKYNISVDIRGDVNSKDVFDIRVNYISLNKGLRSPVTERTIESDIDVQSNYQTKSYEFSVPKKDNIHLMQVVWITSGTHTYYMDSYNLRRNGSGETENFSVDFNGETISSSQESLSNSQSSTTDINSTLINPRNTVSASIDGNKNGIFELKYTNPVAQSLSGTLGVKSVNKNSIDVTVNRIGRYSDRVKLLPMAEIRNATIAEENSYQSNYYYTTNATLTGETERLYLQEETNLASDCDDDIDYLCIAESSQSKVLYDNLSRGESLSVSWNIYVRQAGNYNVSILANSSNISGIFSSEEMAEVSVSSKRNM